MPILHGANLSPFVRKVRFALAIKQIEYESNPIIPFIKTPEFLALNPLGKIPIYEDGDVMIPDSSVIIDYLENTRPEPALYPADPTLRARALFFEEYGDTNLTMALTTPFFQRFIRANFMKEEADEGLITKALEQDLPPCLDYFEGELGDEDYLVGGAYSIADIAVTSSFVNARIGGYEIDAGRWPRMAAYLERCFGNPALKPIVDGDLAAAQTAGG